MGLESLLNDVIEMQVDEMVEVEACRDTGNGILRARTCTRIGICASLDADCRVLLLFGCTKCTILSCLRIQVV